MTKQHRISVVSLLLVLALAPVQADGGPEGGRQQSIAKVENATANAKDPRAMNSSSGARVIDDARAVEEARAMTVLLVKAPRVAMANAPFLQTLFDARKGGAATLFLPLSGFRVLADAVGYDYPRFNRILKYHLIPDARYTIADLKALREDSMLPTAEGSDLKVFSPRGAKIVWLQGRSIIPAAVTIPNLFVGENLIVHGLSRRLIPPSF
ncbi:hypothetical protein CLOM_g15392 [Closterium sp. NIES-68]|nr:hypothetical protein CLOM_g15392 [Closterium sp. NIES-68]GJP65681.1 hypothetical protein CLOP_g22547 [Closterium sp. NIES-67]